MYLPVFPSIFENKKYREIPHVSDNHNQEDENISLFLLFIKWRVLMDELTQGGRAGMADDVPREFAHIYPD